MLKILLSLTLLISITQPVFAQNNTHEEVMQENDFSLYPEPIRAPASLFEDERGRLITLGSFNNKVVILNFWATWCKPCIVEMPSLNALAKKYNSKIAVIPLIAQSEDVSTVRTFYRRYKLTSLDYFIDNDRFTAINYNVTGIPTSFVFNKNGELIAYVDGSINWMSKANLEFIEKVINE